MPAYTASFNSSLSVLPAFSHSFSPQDDVNSQRDLSEEVNLKTNLTSLSMNQRVAYQDNQELLASKWPIILPSPLVSTLSDLRLQIRCLIRRKHRYYCAIDVPFAQFVRYRMTSGVDIDTTTWGPWLRTRSGLSLGASLRSSPTYRDTNWPPAEDRRIEKNSGWRLPTRGHDPPRLRRQGHFAVHG